MIWKILDRKTAYRNRFLEVTEKLAQSPLNSKTHDFYSFEFPDFCNIIPVTAAGEVVMVKQFRMGSEEVSLEIPGGLVDPEDGSPKISAVREMEEETGYALLPQGKVYELGKSHPNPAIQGNFCHFYAAGPVAKSKSQELDPQEAIEVECYSFARVLNAIESGRLNHALCMNAFQLLALRLGDGAKSLEKALQSIAQN